MAPPSGSRNSKAKRDSYHHMIPRFILVRFQSTAHMSKKQREKKYKKTKKDPRKVQFYELATGVLEERSFGEVYGVTNLYRDASSTQDVDELEGKLAVLERDAKAVVDKIHDGVESGTASMLRSQLETLRKFLFLMHYRMDDLSITYFDGDHPNNRESRAWIEKMRLQTGRGKDATPTDIWLYFLRYYLDTPHNTLLDEGERQRRRRISRGRGSPMFHPDDDQNAAASTYWKQGALFDLGIWCAAEDREFILTHNGFGLWEGIASRLARNPKVHRLFVLSPRIAVVLRSYDHKVDCSDLADIDLKPPSTQFAVSGPAKPFFVAHATLTSDLKDIFRQSAYMAGPGQNDQLTFPITRLTSKQTDDFNFVLLRNVEPDVGGLSFRDARLCGEMIKHFCANALANAHEKRDVHRAFTVCPLGWRLTHMVDEKDLCPPPIFTVTASLREKLRLMSYAWLHHCGHPPPPRIVVDSDLTSTFATLLERPCDSEYDRAYQLHTVLRDYGEKHDGLAAAYSSISTHLSNTWLRTPPAVEVDSFPQDLDLLPKLSKADSLSFFAMMTIWLSTHQPLFGFGKGETPEDAVARLLGHTIYLACAEKVLRKAPAKFLSVTEQFGVYICADKQFEQQMFTRIRQRRTKAEKLKARPTFDDLYYFQVLMLQWQ